MNDKAFLSPREVGLAFKDQQNVPFTLFHLNVQSVRNKIEELGIFLGSFNFMYDIIMLTETWYKSKDEVDTLENYKHFNLSRNIKQGGGVCIHVKKCYECVVIDDFTLSTNDYEILTLKQDKFVFSVVYRPPNGNITAFFEFIDVFLRFTCENEFMLFCGGDFNIDMLTTSPRQLEFLSLFQSYGLINAIVQPTRITPNHEALLDLFLTNVCKSNVISGVVGETISDHLPIYMLADIGFQRKEIRSEDVYFRQMGAENLEKFEQQVNSEDWGVVLDSVGKDEAFNCFLGKFTMIYNRCFPYLIHKVHPKSRKPWVTPEILKLINKKNVLYHKFVRSKDVTILSAFRKQRNVVTKALRQAKHAYFNNLFNWDMR